MSLEDLRNILLAISKIGREHPTDLNIRGLNPFRNFFNESGDLIRDNLDEIDGLWTRREILTRYLLLSSVLDQGPDIGGVRLLLQRVTDSLYKQEVRILHKPMAFFDQLNISIDSIISEHTSVKGLRAAIWAELNHSNPNRYSLFFSPEQTFTSTTKQVLGYAIYRWGVPLCLIRLIELDKKNKGEHSLQPLTDYLESSESTEKMCNKLKEDERYGLGKAIGDKACHLFAKFFVHCLKISRRNEISFGPLSFELPLDSNAGRILFRIGFLFQAATPECLKKWEVIQNDNYIRVTNLRDKSAVLLENCEGIRQLNEEITIDILKINRRPPHKVKIQHLPNILLEGKPYGIGDLDDGLIYIGTNFCLNNSDPNCVKCPICKICQGYNENQDWIRNYHT